MKVKNNNDTEEKFNKHVEECFGDLWEDLAENLDAILRLLKRNKDVDNEGKIKILKNLGKKMKKF